MKESKERSFAVVFAAIVCALCIAVMITALSIPKKAAKGEFIPPEFDSAAVSGEPDAPEHMGYAEPYREGMEFRAGLCGNITICGDTADVYFTNKAENGVWLMLRITDESGNTIAETGLIRPGEYVKAVKFTQKPEDGQKVICRVMAYEQGTYQSAGYFTLKTKVRYEK
jgi:hypothetical protein